MQAEIDYAKKMWNIKDSLQPTAKTREKKKKRKKWTNQGETALPDED